MIVARRTFLSLRRPSVIQDDSIAQLRFPLRESQFTQQKRTLPPPGTAAEKLIAPEAEAVIQQARGRVNLQTLSLFTRILMKSACPSSFNALSVSVK